jgi:hypothetical protein
MADKKSRKKKGKQKTAQEKKQRDPSATLLDHQPVDQWKIKEDWEIEWGWSDDSLDMLELDEELPPEQPPLDIGVQVKSKGKEKRVRVGDVVLAIINWPPPLLRVIIVIALLGAMIYLLGQINDLGPSAFLRLIGSNRQSIFTLIESRGEVVLMWESERGRSEVLVQTSPESEWLRISRGDTTAVNPALSPTADRVAYLSLLDSERIVVAPLSADIDKLFIPASVLKNPAWADVEIIFCDWTPIAWSPDGKRLAFYGCYKEKPGSLIFSAKLDVMPVEVSLISESICDGDAERQILWSANNSIILTFPDSTTNRAKELSVP